MNLNNAKIIGTSSFLPTNIVSNQDIIDEYSLKLKDSWVKKYIGISERRWCKDGESASDLGAEVLKGLIQKTGVIPDALIVSTVSQDLMTPSTAAIIQSIATPGEQYPAFDITAACSGFVFALDMGRRFIHSGMKNVACIATEIRSYYLNKKDRRTVMLFGDGSGGAMLSACAEDQGMQFSKTITDGRYWESIVVAGVGTRTKKEEYNGQIEMRNAVLISESASDQMISLAREACEQRNISIKDIDHFIFHQANGRIINEIMEKLDLSEDKATSNFDCIGNITSASVAITLDEAVKKKKIRKGDLVLMSVIGGGFTGGVNIFRWELD